MSFEPIFYSNIFKILKNYLYCEAEAYLLLNFRIYVFQFSILYWFNYIMCVEQSGYAACPIS